MLYRGAQRGSRNGRNERVRATPHARFPQVKMIHKACISCLELQTAVSLVLIWPLSWLTMILNLNLNAPSMNDARRRLCLFAAASAQLQQGIFELENNFANPEVIAIMHLRTCFSLVLERMATSAARAQDGSATTSRFRSRLCTAASSSRGAPLAQMALRSLSNKYWSKYLRRTLETTVCGCILGTGQSVYAPYQSLGLVEVWRGYRGTSTTLQFAKTSP